MEQLESIVRVIALTMGAGWASGINLYAALLTLGLMEATGAMALPPDLQVLAHPLVLGAAGVMFVIEFVADKVPGVDTGWDALHTFIRIPGGAILAAGAVGPVHPAVALAAAIVGGGLAAGSHAAKAGTRVLINASPEPFSNWAASFAEDVAVVAGIWTAMQHPWIFLALLLLFLLLLAWALPKLWRGIKALAGRIAGWVRREPAVTDRSTPPSAPGPAGELGLDPGRRSRL